MTAASTFVDEVAFAAAADVVALVNVVVFRLRAVVTGLAVGVEADGVLSMVVEDMGVEPWESEAGVGDGEQCGRRREDRRWWRLGSRTLSQSQRW